MEPNKEFQHQGIRHRLKHYCLDTHLVIVNYETAYYFCVVKYFSLLWPIIVVVWQM